MISKKLIDELKTYTLNQLPDAILPEYENSGKLLAKDVFEADSDIYINLHTQEVNSITGMLHGHDFFELNYVIHGNCRQNIDNVSEVELSRGALCIMNPDARHNLSVSTPDDIVLNISMKKSLFNATFWSLIEQHENIGQFFLSYFLSRDAADNFLLFNTTPSGETDLIVENICREYLEKKPYCQIALRCMLILFFTEIIRSNTIQINMHQFTSKVSVQITALFNYLSVNYATATLASTAEYFHYHPNYLSGFVKKHTGKTFSAILNDIKLSQASYYLTNTNLPVKDISERLGFGQLCNFYDFIRKNYHTTPVKYRQMHAER